MPRIDPLQLLKCLSVLLSPEGGILSRDEVPRLVNLMTKFSKKLVSKCVYVLILKNTETSLVDMFMAEGGWTLIQSWLQDAAHTGNWDLVKEILGLLLITPVDVERLKMNCLPKLIKNLSRREDLPEVAKSSDQIVQKWLSIVKGTASAAAAAAAAAAASASNASTAKTASEKKQDAEPAAKVTKKEVAKNEVKATVADVTPAEPKNKEAKPSSEENQAIEPNLFYKSNSSKQNSRKLSVESDKPAKPSDDESVKSDEKSEKQQKDKSKSSSRSKSGSSSSRDKEREKGKKKSSSSSSSKSSSTSTHSKDDKKDKERDRKERDKDRGKSSSSSSKSRSKSSSSSSKDKKDSSKDKSKSSQTKEKSSSEKPKPSIENLGRIPKKSSEDKQKENKAEIAKPSVVEEKKKPSFSILNRKATGEERSKTVKVYNSKMRSTGLEEEAKPPPPRTGKKPTPSIQLPTIPPKRPSPPREQSIGMPPEKKIKIDKVDIPERPGAIKLIPPKPKPAVLQESDMFMDALMTASVPKKDVKKRKRRPSITKDTNAPTSPSSSPVNNEPPTPTSPTLAGSTNGLGLKNIAPINFYQDTLSEVSDKPEENASEKISDENKDVEMNRTSPENVETPVSPSAIPEANGEVEMGEDEVPAKQMRLAGELKGVLLYSKKKGPKRTIRWKEEEDLVEIRYFELDETERVNVTKTFMDMAKMDISSEREALIMSRKLPNEDVMEPQTVWRMLYLCEQPDSLALPGSKSLEKDIQFAREKSTLPAIYYDKRKIPDCPEEAIPENHQVSDPVVIPLEDPESQEIDLKSTPWPEPKGFAPNHMEAQPMPPMFPHIPFNPNFGSIGNMTPSVPYGMPHRFPVPPGPHGPMGPGAGQFGPANMMPNMMGPINQPDMMNVVPNAPMNPAGFIPGPDGYNMAPGNEQNYPMAQYAAGPQGPNMNMYGGPNPNNFNHHRGGHVVGRGGGGGGFRRGGGPNNQGWVQLNGPRNNGWKRGGGGGGGRGGRLCKNIQNHGYCRNGDNCPFVH